MEEEKKIICVLGMHRSGTSMLTGVLHTLGIYVGETNDLMQAHESSNPTGHWEHLDVFHINVKILELFGGSWQSPPQFPDNWLDHPGVKALEEDAHAFVKKMNQKSALWAFKEPRTCLTLPFWKKIIPDMHYIIPIRDPLAVSESLHARDGLPIFIGMYLWTHYWNKMVHDTKDEKRIFLGYDDLINEPKKIIKHIVSSLSLTMEDTKKIDAAISFIQPELKHHEKSSKTALSQHWGLLQDEMQLQKFFLHDIQFTVDAMYTDAQHITERQNQELQSLHSSVEQLHKEFAEMKKTITQLKEIKIQLQKKVHNQEKKIRNQDRTIMIMEASRFWKLRNRYIKLKDTLLRK